MTDMALGATTQSPKPKLDAENNLASAILFFGALAGGLAYTAYAISSDLNSANATLTIVPFILLFVALLIALGFEFVNGFHDTANAVATVIYTHSLPAQVAVVWSGLFNLIGVLLSAGTVAFGIISLLPVELILQVGSGAGFAMVFALLVAAILWNIGTWYMGLPASSSHTLIGSIIGVGIANQLLKGQDGTAGVDWTQATNIGITLLVSPLVGFLCSLLLFYALKSLVKNDELYQEPKGNAPPPLWIRGLLVLTCTGVSFAHGSNDGQKGMGLIMLILIGVVPAAYALNRAVPASQVANFRAISQTSQESITKISNGVTAPTDPAEMRKAVTEYIRDKTLAPGTLPALTALIGQVADQVSSYGDLGKIPNAAVQNVRNDMYLISEAIRISQKDKAVTLDKTGVENLTALKKAVDDATKFIPLWVKVVVAIALGLGTMVGWKRIVVTVGEKIGKQHLTYGQGASAELIAMGTILAADNFGLPVSTTHVLSSGIAGTMAANNSGLQLSTIRNIAMAWVLTLPCAILLSGCLFAFFKQIF